MPMPHRTRMQVIKRRLKGKDGSARINELRRILAELPGIYQGPYGKIRAWVEAEIGRTNVRKSVKHNESIAIRKEGHLQVAVIGMPNAGKSSLLRALSGVQTAVGAYPFTTLKPVAALVDIDGIHVQFVEVPGLIEGANEGRGGGRALLGVIRSADLSIILHDPAENSAELRAVLDELALAGIPRPALLLLTKADHDDFAVSSARLKSSFPDLATLEISAADGTGLQSLGEEVTRLSGLIRVFPKNNGERAATPVVLASGSTVLDFARAVHHDFSRHFRAARVWGHSARFPGQEAGAGLVLREGDEVELKRV
jgi:small GTP-binding protein